MADHGNHPDAIRRDDQANRVSAASRAASEDARLARLLSPICDLIDSLEDGEFENKDVNIRVVSTESDWHGQRTENGMAGYDTHARVVTISELVDGRFKKTGELKSSTTRGTPSVAYNGEEISESDIPGIKTLVLKLKEIQATGPVSTEVEDTRSSAADILARIGD